MNRKKLKVFVLAMWLLMPLTMVAQQEVFRGLFGREADPYDDIEITEYVMNRDLDETQGGLFQGFGKADGDLNYQGLGSTGGDITNQTFGEETPLGNGLLILLVASAGYATITSKKRDKKENHLKKKNAKLSTVIMALALVLVLSQCKKNEQLTPTSEGVVITLEVKGNNEAKVNVNPNTGTVDFENNDQIIVASNGKYVGMLTYNGTLFTGAISNATDGYPLQFYFLGNVTPEETLTSGITESCSVLISEQEEHLPVISTAPSNETYDANQTAYTAHLLNKCALVKFNVTTSSTAATCITGFNNKVTVDFSGNTITPSKEGNGVITLPAGNGEKWAILLPQNAVEAGEAHSAYSADGLFSGTRAAVPNITDNGYLTAGIDVTLIVPTGAICGKFTINNNEDKIYFSQGNLQYIGSVSTPYWKFADNQWDCLGTTTGQNSNNQNVDRDLFGWGTSGWNTGNSYYHPWDTYKENGSLYGPPGESNLTGTYANADWGVFNPISNGGNQPNQWRTLTHDEWGYVFNTRTTSSGIRYAKANVNDVNGVILLPDDWSTSYYELSGTNTNNTGYSSNTITASEWSTLEQHGAVFFPANGYRFGESVYKVGVNGYYWSSSFVNGTYAYGMYFSDSDLKPQDASTRTYGRAVRLVHVAIH